MFKNAIRIFVASIVFMVLQPLYSIEIYTVKSGDYLFKIARANKVNGFSINELTDAIKGLNKFEVPGILNNRIQVAKKLAIPTTRDEVKVGLNLLHNSMMQVSHNQLGGFLKETIPNASSKVKGLKLDDQIIITNTNVGNGKFTKIPRLSDISQENTLNMILEDGIPQEIIYENNLNNQIDGVDVKKNNSYDVTSERLDAKITFGKLIELILLLILMGLFVVASKKILNNRSSRIAQEQEIISKKKRDHLMSRISPVVSDIRFYRSEEGLQETFDFCAKNNVDINCKEKEKENVESSGELNNLDINIGKMNHFNDDNVVIKTEKGMIFDTVSNDKFIDLEDKFREINTNDEGLEMQYIEELIEQYLESGKYVEASITIQDSLEKEPNNINLRYMFLEVYAKAGDEIAFEGEVHFIKSKNIVSMFDPLHQKIAKLRDKYF